MHLNGSYSQRGWQFLIKDVQAHLNQAVIEFTIGDLQHFRQTHGEAVLEEELVARLDPALKAKREIVGEIAELLKVALHLIEEVVNFGAKIVVDAEGEEARGAKDHADGLVERKAKALEILELGDEGGLNAGDEKEGGLASDGMGADEAETAEKVECGAELEGDAGDEKARAASDGFPEVVERNGGFMEEEIEDWVEMGVRGAGQQLGMHAQNPAHVRPVYAEGVEAFLDGFEGIKGGRTQVRVLGQGFGGVDVEVAFQVEELLSEKKARVLAYMGLS